MLRSYSELASIPSFLDRYRYLKLDGLVGEDTFGWDRYLNQVFYRSKEWKSVRDKVIIRDCGRDLGVEGYDINSKIIIHHMNPINPNDITDLTEQLMNPEYLICTSFNTHQAIHYGDESLLNVGPIVREPNDTKLW